MVIVIVALASFILGVVVGKLLHREHPIGDLRVDRSDPTCEPYLFLELDTDVRSVVQKKRVVFRVKMENFLSHE